MSRQTEQVRKGKAGAGNGGIGKEGGWREEQRKEGNGRGGTTKRKKERFRKRGDQRKS